MSLRADMHAAIDEVTPPAPMLASQAEWFVLAAERDRYAPSHRRLGRFARPLRGTFVVLAAALVVILMAGLVLGGRLWRDWGNVPAFRSHTISQSELQRLRARSINLPTLLPSGECPVGPTRSLPNFRAVGVSPVVYGDGPVYGEGTGSRYVTPWGTYIQTEYWADPRVSGLVLIRARDLKSGEPVVFSNTSFTGRGNASDRVVGTDFVLEQIVQQHPEFVVDTNQVSAPLSQFWRGWVTLQGYPAGASGCIGFQVDGAGFTAVFVVAY